MKIIQLTQGKSAMVDDGDFDWISSMKWRATKTCPSGIERWYAIHSLKNGGGTVYMHREIMRRMGGFANSI